MSPSERDGNEVKLLSALLIDVVVHAICGLENSYPYRFWKYSVRTSGKLKTFENISKYFEKSRKIWKFLLILGAKGIVGQDYR